MAPAPSMHITEYQTVRKSLLLLISLAVFFSFVIPSAAREQVTVRPSASYAYEADAHGGDPLAALCDGKEPGGSNDGSIPRFTFWSHMGTKEWVQLDFDQPTEVANVEFYWYDDRPGGGCRVPQTWKLFYKSGYSWEPVANASAYTTNRDQYNKVTFTPVTTAALRIDVQMQPNASGGILQWRINGKTPKLGSLIGEKMDALAMLETRLAAAMAGDNGTSQQVNPKQVLARLAEQQPEAWLKLRIQLDWLAQDAARSAGRGFPSLAAVVIEQLGPAGVELRAQGDQFPQADAPQWMELYLAACEKRRELRLTPHRDKLRRIVFTKHHDLGGQHYAYTEDVSDSPYNDGSPFPPTGKLCLLEMDGLYGTVRTLLDEPVGVIRDPDVSYDGRRILFAWRKSMTEDDYHLYEMNADDWQIRQLTSGQGVADYEGVYLPGGDILFNSSRCQQIVDCWFADVSNLYTCNADGQYLRRLSFDQVHSNYPQVLSDGRVIYTRWDYNDRGQLYPQPLFQMYPDGTAQTELYGNNSWFPTAIFHAREIPGTQKLLTVLGGHHAYQRGKLAIIDPSKGRQENSGVQLIAPIRETKAERIDQYGGRGEQFQYPYALNETEYLLTYTDDGGTNPYGQVAKPFGIYYMTIDGDRELLAADPTISCSQPVPLAERREPGVRPSPVDYRKSTGTFFLQDVYLGPGLQDVPRGTIKRLRVVAIEFRAAAVGSNGNSGPAGGATVSTPVSINGTWDVKRVLGTAEVYEDGSAAFLVPARTPVYFQALDANNHAVQTMRSWSTLQPGETFSCVGCHEDKNSTPAAEPVLTQAGRIGPKPLTSFYGQTAGFSFPQTIQPILDSHCVECHSRQTVADGKSTISLEATGELDGASQKTWSDGYKTLADRKFASWVSPQSAPPMLSPYHTGAAKSPLIKLLVEGHEDVALTQEEFDKLACWIDIGVPYSGDYTEKMNVEQLPTYNKYLAKRKHWEAVEAENIRALIKAAE